MKLFLGVGSRLWGVVGDPMGVCGFGALGAGLALGARCALSCSVAKSSCLLPISHTSVLCAMVGTTYRKEKPCVYRGDSANPGN